MSRRAAVRPLILQTSLTTRIFAYRKSRLPLILKCLFEFHHRVAKLVLSFSELEDVGFAWLFTYVWQLLRVDFASFLQEWQYLSGLNRGQWPMLPLPLDRGLTVINVLNQISHFVLLTIIFFNSLCVISYLDRCSRLRIKSINFLNWNFRVPRRLFQDGERCLKRRWFSLNWDVYFKWICV